MSTFDLGAAYTPVVRAPSLAVCCASWPQAMLYGGCAEAEMLELELLLPGRHACTQGRRCRSVPAVYPVTAAVIARASARSRSTAHVRRWRPALAGHPAERRPPGRRKPLPRGGEGKGLLRGIRLPARAAYIAIMSQLTRTCQSQVDARHRTRAGWRSGLARAVYVRRPG